MGLLREHTPEGETPLRSHSGTQLQLHCPLLATDAGSPSLSPLSNSPKLPPQRFPYCCNDKSAKDWLLLCNYDSIRLLTDKISGRAAKTGSLICLCCTLHLTSPFWHLENTSAVIWPSLLLFLLCGAAVSEPQHLALQQNVVCKKCGILKPIMCCGGKIGFSYQHSLEPLSRSSVYDFHC